MTPPFRWAPLRSIARAPLRALAPWLLPLLAGMLLFALFGTVPARLESADMDRSSWALPDFPDRAAEDAAASAVWADRHPWGDAPASAAGADAAVPVPVPVAIVSTAAGHEAIFVMPGSGEIRARPGDTLPDGGRVDQVDALSVAWTDGQGQSQRQRLLSDPQRPLVPVP